VPAPSRPPAAQGGSGIASMYPADEKPTAASRAWLSGLKGLAGVAAAPRAEAEEGQLHGARAAAAALGGGPVVAAVRHRPCIRPGRLRSQRARGRSRSSTPSPSGRREGRSRSGDRSWRGARTHRRRGRSADSATTPRPGRCRPGCRKFPSEPGRAVGLGGRCRVPWPACSSRGVAGVERHADHGSRPWQTPPCRCRSGCSCCRRCSCCR